MTRDKDIEEIIKKVPKPKSHLPWPWIRKILGMAWEYGWTDGFSSQSKFDKGLAKTVRLRWKTYTDKLTGHYVPKTYAEAHPTTTETHVHDKFPVEMQQYIETVREENHAD